MPNLERDINQYSHISQRAQELTSLVRDQITKFQAGEIPKLPKRKELNEQVGYNSSVSFDRALRRAGLLEEWRRVKKVKKIERRTYYDNLSYDNSGADLNIPPVLRDAWRRVVWGLPNNTQKENEQIGISNIQALFLKNFPDFNDLFPRGEDGKIAEEKIADAKIFILGKLKSLREFLKVLTSPTVDRKYTPYFNGSHIVAIQKSFFPWGLKFERSEFEKSGREEISLSNEAFVPSHELAWIIGVLAGGGYSNPNDKRISLDSSSEEFVRAFRSAGERVFSINASVRTKKGENNTRRLKGVVFHSKKVTEAMGDLRGSEWPSTIIDQHKWIIENSNYLWSFIEGIFERKGGIYKTRDRIRSIAIFTDHVNIANFIMDLLVRTGVQNPVIEYNRRGQEGIKGVRLSNIQDMRHFAENIHSRIPEKEKRLGDCRELKRYDRSRSTPPSTVATKEEALQEWTKNTTFVLKQYEDEKGIQIRYVPKVHRELEEEKKKKLEEIIMGTEESPESQVLFGPDGKSPILPHSAVEDHIQRIAESNLEDRVEPGTELYIATKAGQERLVRQVLPKGSKRNWTPEEVRREAVEFYNIFERLSTKTLRKHKRWDLQNAISRYPGRMKQLKVDLGLEPNTILTQQSEQPKFTLEQIEEEALKIYQTERKLTKDVLERLGRNDLVWAIRKHYPGRYKGLRAKLNIPEKPTKQGVENKPFGYWGLENIEREAMEFYSKGGRLSHKGLKKANRQDLLHGIRRHYPGGLSALKEKFNEQETQIFP